jgi:spore photoproduct lyase
VRDGVRLLLRAAAQGLREPDHDFREHRADLAATERHVARQGVKSRPNQCDLSAWVYDLGENSDVAVDALISDNVRDLVQLFRGLSTAKASFATKFVNRELLGYDPRGRTRIRFSLMPTAMSRLLDVRTSPPSERICAVDDFVDAGYEVHLNFSPVVVEEGWLERWRELFDEIDETLGAAAKAQLKAEVIFLTHNDRLHEVNLGWHPRAEQVLWQPELQEPKRSQTGGWNVRYRRGLKRELVAAFRALIEERLPYCDIRYAF